MNIAIVILNWNGRKLLEEFLPSVVEFSDQATIYLADNASTDSSVSFVTTKYPDIKIIHNKVNGGYAKGYNDALEEISADIYCLLNSDIAVSKNWLPPILKAFESSNEVAAVQPKLLDYKRKEYFEYAGAGGGFIDQFGYPYCRGRIFDTVEKDEGQYDDEIDIFWASGACLFIRKKVFEAVGKLDEDFFAHQEEIDLCWRIRNAGYSIRYVGTSVVYHLGGGTLDAMNPKKTYLNFRNSLYMILKNVPRYKVWKVLFIRMILDGIAAFKFILEGKFAYFTAIIKAHIGFYKNFPKIVKKRAKHAQQKKYYHVPSVVWQYYLRKNKHFKELIGHII